MLKLGAKCFPLLIFMVFEMNAQGNDFWLSKDVKPKHYQITLNPNLDQGVYHGKVKIELTIEKPTAIITLHSKNLTITKAQINGADVESSENPDFNFLTLKSSKELEKGDHTLKLEFDGDMKDKTYGFFRGYEEEDGKKTYFGASFLEPINARVAFPCFDEPAFKAQFSIRLGRPSGYVALSNMNAIAETEENGTEYVHFAKTPLMSTYLVSFFVGKYAHVQDFHTKQNGERIPVRIYTPPGKTGNVLYGVRELVRQLQFVEKYTGIDYVLPKLDYITINEEFHAEGGMEDWGAITGREDSVFFNSNMSILQSSAGNMGHELGHAWFGNLVTTSSWGELWLNEGFDRFMDYNLVDLYKEEDHSQLHYSTRIRQAAMWGDDDLRVKSLAWTIEKPDDIYGILDNLAYDKGGSVLVMVERTIGKSLMQKVVHSYLNEHKFGNVNSRSFAGTLQNFVDFNATEFLKGFVEQSGYPLVTVEFAPSMKKVTLKQERFLRAGQRDENSRWTFPIFYYTNLDRTPKLVWFEDSQTEVILSFPTEISWIKLNSNQSGYYRTNYPNETWHTFAEIINELPISDRINLLDDSAALLRANKTGCDQVLNLTTYLGDEEEYEVWYAANFVFQVIANGLIQNDLPAIYLKKYVADLVDTQYRKTDWTEQENIRDKVKQSLILNLACQVGHRDCKKKVKQLWDEKDSLHVDVRNILWANDPYRDLKSHRARTSSLNNVSKFFGATESQMPYIPYFVWPKDMIEGCNDWLKKKTV